MGRVLVQTLRPAVVTGITPDGWLTRRAGDIVIRAYRCADGRMEYETRAARTA